MGWCWNKRDEMGIFEGGVKGENSIHFHISKDSTYDNSPLYGSGSVCANRRESICEYVD